MSCKSDFLKQLIELVQKENLPIFASKEDADFYRRSFEKAPLFTQNSLAHISHTISRDGASDLISPGRKHCQNDKESVREIKDDVPDCTDSPREYEKCGLEVKPPCPETSLVFPKEEKVQPEPKKPVQPPPLKSTTPPSEPTYLIQKTREKPAPKDFSRLKTVLKTAAPEFSPIETVPNDAIAIKISERWRTKNQSAPISILTYQEPVEQKALLEEIAKAIDIYFGPAKLVHAENIEKEKQWETFLSVKDLKWVIICDYSLWQLSSLLEHYKEMPATKTRALGKIPLFLLPDLSLYLKDPQLKRSLWNGLKECFGK